MARQPEDNTLGGRVNRYARVSTSIGTIAARIGAACRAPGGAGLDGMSGLAHAYTVCR